jgi:hypothetical protein
VIEDCRLVIAAKSLCRNPRSKIQSPKSSFLAVLLFALLAPGCAGRRQPVFVPAAREEAERALAIWRDAAARAETRGPARLLYEARVSQGPFRMSGTLAVVESSRAVDATLSGPFGDVVARYEDGALRGNGIRPILVAPDELRSLLAGIWKGTEEPAVAGMDGQDALLRWTGPEQVEGVLNLAAGRFKSLRVTRPEGAIIATYSGDTSSRPQRIELEDVKSGNTMRLTLIAAEPASRRESRVESRESGPARALPSNPQLAIHNSLPPR